MKKSYIIKVFDRTRTYLKTVNPKDLISEVRFDSHINGGQGECVLDLDLPMDSFGEGTDIAHMNIVEISEWDDVNALTPRIIYTGFVSRYAPFFDEGQEGVRLTLLGLGSLLSGGFYKNGSSYTVTATSLDPTQIMKNILGHFSGVYPAGILGYSGGHADSVGTLVTYTFTDLKWADAIKKAFELAGGGWWWRLDETGELWVKAKPVAATHRFTLGKDVSTGEVTKSNEQVINQLQLRWGSPATATDYQDATSIAAYGRHEKVITESAIYNLATANQRGNQEITDNKDPKVQARLRINANYDIESVKPGDTCTVLNVKQGSTVFPANMLITGVAYSPDGIDIELENTQVTFADHFKTAVKAVQ